jgi:putative Ca2+/H+ antiporter (TMEM165/GDT1 family)
VTASFFVSTLVVSLAEIGDKTQLLSLMLAARFRRPVPIVIGILVATLLNHALAAWLGQWAGEQLQGALGRWIVGLSMIVMALWTLKPDKLDDTEVPPNRYGLLALTFVLFFVAEIGDKTQVATVLLAAEYQSLIGVVAGTTLGMMIANVPAVLLGARFANRMPLKNIRTVTAGVFFVLGVLALAGI